MLKKKSSEIIQVQRLSAYIYYNDKRHIAEFFFHMVLAIWLLVVVFITCSSPLKMSEPVRIKQLLFWVLDSFALISQPEKLTLKASLS